MAWTYDQLIAEYTSRVGQANAHKGTLNLEITEASIDWNAGDDHAAIQDIIQGLQATLEYMVDMLARGFHGWNGATYALPTALDRNKACPFITEAPAYDLTMDAIINTMLTADPAQTLYYIGLVDAYRQSVWNRPFNREFFAALARGFAEWD